MNTPEGYVSLAQAAKEIDRTPIFIKGQILKGTLKHEIIGKKFYIRRDHFDRYKAAYLAVEALKGESSDALT